MIDIKRALLPALIILGGCVADRTMSPAERHRAWVCQHRTEYRFAITTGRLAAEKIRDERARAAAHAALDAETAVLASCSAERN